MYKPQLSDFVRFWCIFCMVSFTRRVRIPGAGVGVLHATQLIGHAAQLLYLKCILCVLWILYIYVHLDVNRHTLKFN